MFITSVIAALLVGLHLVLALWVVLARALKANPEVLHQRQRVHGNLIENAPLFLIVLGLAEAQDGSSAGVLWALGLTFFVARLIHAYGLALSMELGRIRFVGTSVGWTTMSVAAGYAVWVGL